MTGVAVAAIVVALIAGHTAGVATAATAGVAVVAVERRARRPQPPRSRRRLSLAERTSILDRDGWACVRCGSTTDLELDHVIPFARGGACSATNLQTLCQRCNRRKGAG